MISAGYDMFSFIISIWEFLCEFDSNFTFTSTGSDDKTVKLWTTSASHGCVHTFSGDGASSGLVTHVAWHPAGVVFAAAAADATVRLWDIRTNKLLQHYSSHNG